MRFLTICVGTLLLVTASVAAQIQSSPGPPQAPEEVYLSIRYASVVDDHLVARYHEGDVYVPVGVLFKLLHIEVEVDAVRERVCGFFLKKAAAYDLDFGRGKAVVGRQFIELDPSDYLIGDDDVFLHPELLDRLFGLRLIFNMSDLTLFLETDENLPVKKAAERRRNRSRVHDPHAEFRRVPLLYPRQRKWLGLGQLDYALSTGRSSGEVLDHAAIRAGLELLGGDLRLDANGTLSPVRLSHSEFRWRYVFDVNPWLTRIDVGRLGSTGWRALRYEGITITNEPIEIRPLLVSKYDVTGVTQPEWETELYLNGHLVDYGRAQPTGHYRFTIPLPYGTSNVRLVHYGPAGEVVSEHRRLEIPYSFLPPGEASYTIHAGRAAADGLDSSRNRPIVQVHGSMGLSSRITARIGVDYLADSLNNLPVAYGRISTRLSRQFLFSLQGGSSSHIEVALDAHFASRSAFNLRYGRRANGWLPDPLRRWNEKIQVAGYAPLQILPMSLYLSATLERYTTWDRYALRGHLAARLSKLQLRTEIQTSVQEHGGVISATDVLLSPSVVAPVLSRRLGPFRGASLRAWTDIDAIDGTPAAVGMELFTGFLRSGNLRLTLNRNSRSGRTVAGIRFTYDLPAARAATAAQHNGYDGVVLQSISGSIGVDRRRSGIVLGNRESVGRAAVSIRMFVDENGNGLKDTGERWVEKASVHVAETGRLERADSVTIHIFDLRPHARYNVTVDESSIRNPLWVPQNAEFSFVADPNVIKAIDIPLYAAGAIEGTVTRTHGGRTEPVPAARVHLFHSDGTLQETLTTFSDGTFYSITLPPGDYEARLDSAQLADGGFRDSKARIAFTIKRTATGDFVDNLAFALGEEDGGSLAAKESMDSSGGVGGSTELAVDGMTVRARTGESGESATGARPKEDGSGKIRGPISGQDPDRNYVVKQTDVGLMDIARRVYGDGYLWPAIYWANRAVLTDPDRIEPGQRLTIPSRQEARAREIWTLYKVRRTDVGLMDISRKLYQDGYLWPEIWHENRDRIPDPDLIYPGQQLNIPYKTSLTERDQAGFKEESGIQDILTWDIYEVQSRGLGLMEVARRVYGDAFLWPKIFVANRDHLESPHLVRRGQRLRVPKKAPLTSEEQAVLDRFGS